MPGRPFKLVVGGAAALACTLLLTGCLKMGPDWSGAPKVIATPSDYQHSTTPGVKAALHDRWWEDFHNPEINRLVKAAIAHNLDLKAAAARVLEVKAFFTQARGDRFPTLGVQGEAQRSKSSSAAASASAGRAVDTTPGNTVSLALAASFEVDLWGRLARADEAARADLLAAEENQRTVIHTVVAGVVASYLEQEALERRIQMMEAALKAYETSLDVVRGRYERGLASVLDVRQSSRALAAARARLPLLRLSLGKAQQNLAILVGSYPKTRPPRAHPADYYQQMEAIPAGLPSELLLKRPDVRQAVAELKALNARIGQAKAARFPSIRLTAGYGTASDELSDLFKPASELWSMATGLSASIFDAGRLAAGQRAAEARYQRGMAAYAKTVLNAFGEVEAALLTSKEQTEARNLTAEALREARSTQSEAEARYLRGLVDYITVLEAQKTRYQIEDELILSELAVLANRVTLYRVLGGGWDRRLMPANKSR